MEHLVLQTVTGLSVCIPDLKLREWRDDSLRGTSNRISMKVKRLKLRLRVKNTRLVVGIIF